jgi:sugar phosphate isomerase/epimerase
MPVAEEMDILICLENHKDNTIESIEDYRRIFDAVDSRNLGICIDTGHFDASGVDMDELIDEFSARVNHIHLKENRGKGTKQFTRFTEGTTDNHHIIRRMVSLGYSGYLTIELSPEIGEHDGRPFTRADIELPYRMFSPYEKM